VGVEEVFDVAEPSGVYRGLHQVSQELSALASPGLTVGQSPGSDVLELDPYAISPPWN
jgi:hypothetical protein